MKITELPAYKRLEERFREKGYFQGINEEKLIGFEDDEQCIPDNEIPNQYEETKVDDIPEEYLTREFFIHELSGAKRDIVDYVKSHSSMFDKLFYKDHIATNYFSLELELNDFEFMPIDFIDEEMVACAMFKSIDMRYAERRGDCQDWFYSVYKRKPELLTQDLYILGARCFAQKLHGKNQFLDITPEEYRTKEFYFALCLKNDTPVMEDIPKNILTTQFLTDLLNDSAENIKCFTNEALERKIEIEERGIVKCWQAAVIKDGYQIEYIPLNDERIEFFLSIYDKDSPEYEYGFKAKYKRYLSKKNPNHKTESIPDDWQIVPIFFDGTVPTKYSKIYDKEEYLLEVYKKMDIQILQKANRYYFAAILPDNMSIINDGKDGYFIKDGNGRDLIHFYDRGPIWDIRIAVNEINVTL